MWLERPALLDGGPAVTGLADDLEVGLGGQDHPQPCADERLVVGQDHPDRRRLAHESSSE
ncbi:hypothetical protein [Nocardioides euryhalodurans]|uniref:hypothetical protein n=1 Tax=Nocardioides euryhalodurans TaxID=2518370 RepID=UPI001FC9B33D|nr:hypothetical protein [Nocardioides euryhalodurans]